MGRRFFQTVAAIIAALMLSACAGGISREARSQVTYTGSFENVLENPEAFRQQAVIWGGKVIEISNQGGLTEIVALQLALDGKDRPSVTDTSRGRFLVRTEQFMDPVIYPAGTLFTVVGRVQGAESRLIDEMAYEYPVIDVVELKKYERQQKSTPRFHIGIGVGTHF